MPCKCSGLRVDRCNCKLVGTRYTWFFWPQTACRSTGIRKKPNVFIRLLEHLYDKCAGYNLRTTGIALGFYDLFNIPGLLKAPAVKILLPPLFKKYCPFRGFAKTDNYISHTLKDLLILACFIVANLVVLLAILVKTILHVYYLCMQMVQWMNRQFSYSKPADESMPVMNKPTLGHDYSPPVMYKMMTY